jgi:hypothetical protein
MRLKVAEGTQVNVNGKVYSEGQSFEPVDDRHAHELLVAGIAIDDSPEVERPSAAFPIADDKRTARRRGPKRVAEIAKAVEEHDAKTR